MSHPVPRWYKYVLLIFIVVPLLGFIAGLALAIQSGLSATVVVVTTAFFMVSILGINIGYHRLFTHKSFETFPSLRAFFAICGSFALEGGVISWVADHRKHHQFSDTDGDPHSPHGHGEGILAMLYGIWHSHVGWLFTQTETTDQDKYAPDLLKDGILTRIEKQFPIYVALSILLPGIVTGLVGQSWNEALMGFLWGALGRIFIVHHITWSINSWCHVSGSRPFARTSHQDRSGNVWILGLISGGESFHHNHHRFPTSARHGLRWWEFDASWWIIWILWKSGLAWNVRTPDPEKIEQAR